MKNRIVTIVSMIFLVVLCFGGCGNRNGRAGLDFAPDRGVAFQRYRVGRTEFSIGSSSDFDKGELSDGIWL